MQAFSRFSDEELMTQLASNELGAAAVLFDRYKAPLFGFFLRLHFSRESAEDLVQTVFERLIRYRQSYRSGMGFRAWLYQIARNTQADYRKREIREDAAFMEIPNESAAEGEERIRQLEQALARLPADQLELLLLTRYQGLKYAEAGAVLGCSEGAVKVKAFRALQQLRAIYFKIEKSNRE